ncbi:uncharacterized protein LOC134536655 [Bacillus rossius redtenbacheri]|uniref:uncharacterized protein LOC134536655 n=1 Tax=Bacillus rossius redtenbacheri TaxID=93214 RepID=UPI002FDEDF7B
MARLGPQHLPHTQAVLLRDVPSMIPVEDIRQAFQELSIPVGAVDRSPQHVRVEVLRRSDYELLLVRGLSFFGVTSFAATPDPGQHGRAGDGPGSRDAVVQCYRCQGFWHTAASCRHQPRCVRCGEAHGVELCVHPRDDPTCCNCRGRHHASYAHCPVRVRLSSAVPVCLALSGGRHGEPA